MKIHQLEKSKWLKDKQRRRGRGDATGRGNYSWRWLKWQKARSWSSRKAFFEWGQTSIVQRLPKARGFKRYYKLIKKVTIINLGVLDADVRIVDGMSVTKEVLKELWYIKTLAEVVKILWHGDYAKKITFVEMNAISASAQQKIDNPGTVHSVPRKAPVKVVASKKKVPVKKVKAVSVVVVKKETVKKPATKTASVKSTPVKKAPVKKTTSKTESVKKPVVKKPAVKKTK